MKDIVKCHIYIQTPKYNIIQVHELHTSTCFSNNFYKFIALLSLAGICKEKNIIVRLTIKRIAHFLKVNRVNLKWRTRGNLVTRKKGNIKQT